MHQEHWEIDPPTWWLVDVQLYLLIHNSVQIAIKLWGFQLCSNAFTGDCICAYMFMYNGKPMKVGMSVNGTTYWSVVTKWWTCVTLMLEVARCLLGQELLFLSLSLQFSIWVITVCPHTTLRGFFFLVFFKKTLKTRLSCRGGEESTRAAWLNWWPLVCAKGFCKLFCCYCVYVLLASC